MNLRILCSLLVFLLCGEHAEAQQKVMKVACVGNSITYGSGITNREQNSYPAQLQAFLGNTYEVKNFGVSGCTVLAKGDLPYRQTEAFQQSLAYQPDVVLIKLGTNDTKPENWAHRTRFRKDYQALIDAYRKLDSSPRIILLTPLRCFLPEGNTISGATIEREVCPQIEQLAKRNKLEVIHLTDVLGTEWDESLLPDKLHPSSIGAGVIAGKIGRYLLYPSDSDKTWNECTHAVPGNEFRSGAGWLEGYDWHRVADDIKETLEGKQLKLLLLGNSITQGWGGNRKAVTYKPGKQAMDEVLGENTWESAGISGDRTQNLLWRIRYDDYNRCKPQNVVIAIGINNLISGGNTPEEVAEGLIAVSEEACNQFPDSRIVLLGVLPSGKEKTSEIRRKCERVHQRLAAHAFQRTTYVDVTSCFLDEQGNIRDGLYAKDYIHLTHKGYKILAKEIARLIGKAPAEENLADKPWQHTGKVKNGEWHGYKVYEYKLDAFTVQVAMPAETLPGRPWVLSIGELEGYHWQLNEKLLQAGMCVVGINSYNVYGADYGLALMDSVYHQVRHRWNMSERCGLSAVSRAGLSVYRWAGLHPEQVACIYCEGPVLDFKTWPMAWPQSSANWIELKKYYGFANDAEAISYKGNPIDNLAPIAQAQIPLRHVISLTEEHDTKIVPNDLNTLKAQRILKQLGHEMEVVIVPEGMVVPYVFDDESVTFIVSNATLM